jgi:uncharacterized damage-inducible protein DinB
MGMLESQLIKLLDGGWAHASIESVVQSIPPEYRAKKVRGLPYTLWDLLEHVRLSQRDILEYMRDPDYLAPDWPKEYWPTEKKPTGQMWKSSVEALLKDHRAIRRIIKGCDDLLSPVPSGKKSHTILREILLLGNHNSYHLGQMVTMRRLLGIWK